MPPPPPCEERICASKTDALRSMFAKAKPRAKPAAQPAAQAAAAQAPCPPDRDLLGRHSWTLLHTLAAYYPEAPSQQQQAAAHSFVAAVSELFPCSHCREDFREAVEEAPPRVGSRAELSRWMCEQHNLVSEKIGKPPFACDLRSLDYRWREGGAHCDTLGEADDETPGAALVAPERDAAAKPSDAAPKVAATVTAVAKVAAPGVMTVGGAASAPAPTTAAPGVVMTARDLSASLNLLGIVHGAASRRDSAT
jgi:FAD-linked sulfhydryl oxidase